MRNRKLRPLLLTFPLLAPLAAAEAFSQDFAITYDIRPDGVRHALVGSYTSAIDCSSGWSRRDLIAERIDMPILEPISIQQPRHLQSAGATHVLKYSVSLSQGLLRVIETKNGTRTADHLYACASYTLNPGPALYPTSGEQRVTFRANALQSACSAAAEGGGPGLAPLEFDLKGAAKSYPVKADDSGLCFQVGYMGMAATPACATAPRECVPFSGRVDATVRADAPETDDVDVLVGGIACDFMVVGGYCWSGELQGGAPGGPVIPEDPVWNPCDCTATILPAIYTPTNATGNQLSAVGSWSLRVYRAP